MIALGGVLAAFSPYIPYVLALLGGVAAANPDLVSQHPSLFSLGSVVAGWLAHVAPSPAQAAKPEK